MPARLALAIDGASATESIGCRKMTEAPLLIRASIKTRLHLDLVLTVEQFVVDDLLRLEDLLDSLGPRSRNRVRLPLNERHLVARAFSAGAGDAHPAAVEVPEQRASCASQGRRSRAPRS